MRFARLFPLLLIPVSLSAQKRAITFEDYINLPVVSDPQLSPDGHWVAYTVSTPSLAENRGIARIWLADATSGDTRQLTQGPGSDRSPRWSPDGRTLAFISSRQSGPQIWVLSPAGGEAHKLTSIADGVGEIYWKPDGSGLLAVVDVKWPAEQEIDQRNGEYATDARIWTELFWRHWDDFRVGHRQHVVSVDLATGAATDLTPVDHDVPTIATSGDGDVDMAPDGREIAVAMHGDDVVATNTNVDIYVMGADGSGRRNVTAALKGAENTPRYSPDGKWLSFLSMARPGFEADRQRLMLMPREGGGAPVEATAGWTLSVGSYTWCPDSKCVYAVVEERGRMNVHRIEIPTFHHAAAITGGVNSNPNIGRDGQVAVYVHQSDTHPAEVWAAGKPLTHHSDAGIAGLDLSPLEEFGFVGARGDSVFGWLQKPPGFDPAKKYPMVYLLHGGPQTEWLDLWHARWNYQMFASRGYVVAVVNRHGSTGYGQAFTDEVSRDWGGAAYEDLMKGLDVLSARPYVDGSRVCAAGASYGGYMIYWMAGHTNRFKCFVAHDGVFNPVSMAGSTEELWFVNWDLGGTPYANRPSYEKFSPLNFVRNWKTPILIVHSQLDYRVDLSEGYQAFTAAKQMGVPSKFLYFPDEGHWILKPRNRRIWWGVVQDWIDQNLK